MGRVIKELAKVEIDQKAIFDKRFVVEICEKVHVHYRNLRILLSLQDFISMAKGMSDSLKRLETLGTPEPDEKKHIELCRKSVASDPQGEGIKVSLNQNLYNLNKGKVFSDGAEFDEPIYAHLKIRDLRVELSLDEFHALAKAMREAVSAMNVTDRELAIKSVEQN